MRKQLPYLIFTKDGRDHLGTIGAHPHDWEIPICEIGYWLRSDKTGQGFMTEAVKAVSRMLREFIKIKRIQIRADEQNVRSRRVAELAGFQLEGILRCDSKAVGEKLRNTCVFGWIDGDQM